MVDGDEKVLGTSLIVISVIVLVAAQSLMKLALSQYGPVPLRPVPAAHYFFELCLDWRFLLSASGVLLSAFLWYAGLSRTPLSFAFPVTAISYPLVLLSAVFLLGEKVSVALVLGNAMIVAGVLTIGYSRGG